MPMPKSIRRIQNRAVLGRGVVLHASAAVVDGRGILFLAPSGGGKSTTADTLERFGMDILGDDSTVISEGTDGVWRVIPCAVYSWSTGNRPPARELHELIFLEKGEPACLRRTCSVYAAYRMLREDSIISVNEMEPRERRVLRDTARLLCRTLPVYILRWSRPDSLRRILMELHP